MISSVSKDSIREKLQVYLGSIITNLSFIPVTGGCINSCYKVVADHHFPIFCKINSASVYPMLFENETTGLNLLREQQLFRIPEVIDKWIVEEHQVLLMEWIEKGELAKAGWKVAGEQLARLHRVTKQWCGFDSDNYIGALKQSNAKTETWTSFFVQQRLQPQVGMAYNKKLLDSSAIKQFEKLFRALDALFPIENPALLHGDLWNGNFFFDKSGTPVLVDPAVYFGHRSMDLAMTTLFGGFDRAFYDAYNDHYPLPSNHRQQWDCCNLYPLLVHLNCFGNSYHAAILSIIRRY